MWAVGPNAAAPSGGFWMLPVSASSAAAARPAEQPMWSFSGGGTATVQAPLQFMSRASYPSNAGGGGGGGMSDTNIGMLAGLNAYNRGGSEDQQPEGDQQHGGGNEDEDGDDSGEENHGNNSSQ